MSTTVFVTLEHIECGVEGCGVIFGISPAAHAAMKERGRHVWCPNGHEIWYSDNELKRARDELAREKHRREQAQAEAEWQRQRVENRDRSIIAIRGHHTRLKKRVAHGVCPCCQRTFQNLARHMKSQHKTYGTEESA